MELISDCRGRFTNPWNRLYFVLMIQIAGSAGRITGPVVYIVKSGVKL